LCTPYIEAGLEQGHLVLRRHNRGIGFGLDDFLIRLQEFRTALLQFVALFRRIELHDQVALLHHSAGVG